MTERLFRLAAERYPRQPVAAAIFARHERPGAWAAFLLAGVGAIAFDALGWPSWLGAGVGGLAAGLAYVAMCDHLVLVPVGNRVLVHRSPRWTLTASLGELLREAPDDEVRRARRGVFNDAWLVGDTRVKITRSDSDRLADLVGAPVSH